jgi:hypothetical protein
LFSIVDGVPELKTTNTRNGSWYFNATGLKLLYGQLYNATDGKLFETDLQISWGDTPGKNGRVLFANGTSSPSFMIGGYDFFPFTNTMNLLTGHVIYDDLFSEDERNKVSNGTGIQYKNEFFERSSLGDFEPHTLDLQQIVDQGGLPWAIPHIAAIMSRYIREKDGIPVPARSFSPTTIVEVRWPWLSLPAVVWLCATIFLVMTVWTCRGPNRVLWKTSSLPLVYHGFGGQDVEDMKAAADDVERVSGMEKFAKTLHASLRKDSNNEQLKLVMVG